MKIFNVKGIAILIGIFLALQIIFAFVLSPILRPIVIKSVNAGANAKITIAEIVIWPLTLSCSLKDLKVFEADDETKRIALIEKAAVRISPIALLSKRLVISKLKISGAKINLKGEPDGSFNIQKLTEPKDAPSAPKPGMLDRFKKKKDWFSRISGMVKKKFADDKSGKDADAKVETKKVKKEVVALPRGRRVKFVRPSDKYIFEIKDFAVKGAQLILEDSSGQTLNLEKAHVYIKNLKMDPKAGARFERIGAQGRLKKNNSAAGSLDLDYLQKTKGGKEKAVIDLSAKDIDMRAAAFLYQDSLPVTFKSGTVSLESKTNILDGNLSSNNTIVLKNHELAPRGGAMMVGMVPLPVICDALGKVNPAEMKFQITGTVEKPKFEGFQKVLLDLIKPYMTDVTAGLKEKGLSAIGDLFKK